MSEIKDCELGKVTGGTTSEDLGSCWYCANMFFKDMNGEIEASNCKNAVNISPDGKSCARFKNRMN